MENILAPSSNTLLNAARLAAGYLLAFEIMPTATGDDGAPTKVAVKVKPTPITTGGKVAKSLPVFSGEYELANLDAELTQDLYNIFQGEIAGTTNRIADYQRALAESEKPLTNQDTAAKTGSMPPPTGKREATPAEVKAATTKTPAKPATPAKPSGPAKPGTLVVESDGTGANAPAKPNPQAAPAAQVEGTGTAADAAVIDVEPIDETSAVAQSTIPDLEEEFEY